MSKAFSASSCFPWKIFIAVRAFIGRETTRRELFDLERVAVHQQGMMFSVQRSPLAHAKLDLLVEDLEHRQRIVLPAVDPDQGYRISPPSASTGRRREKIYRRY